MSVNERSQNVAQRTGFFSILFFVSARSIPPSGSASIFCCCPYLLSNFLLTLFLNPDKYSWFMLNERFIQRDEKRGKKLRLFLEVSSFLFSQKT
jgi:hypothetical protein